MKITTTEKNWSPIDPKYTNSRGDRYSRNISQSTLKSVTYKLKNLLGLMITYFAFVLLSRHVMHLGMSWHLDSNQNNRSN